MDKEHILNELENIVGKDYASNTAEDLYIYSQDPGASLPRQIETWQMSNIPRTA